MRFGRCLVIDVSRIGMEQSEDVRIELFLVNKYYGGQNWFI